jgi:Tat protein translocase TatB subunit
MSGVGFSELLILFLIGLIVLGPEKLPRVANQLGNWIGQARRMTRVMKRQLEDELSLEGKSSYEKPASVSKPAYVTPANETDDNYSPVHGPEDPGTGVGSVSVEEPVSEEEPVSDEVTRDDGTDLDDDVARATPSPGKLNKEQGA